MSTAGQIPAAFEFAAGAGAVAHGPVPSGEAGGTLATVDLVPLFYGELRRIAAWRLAGERAGHSLQVTALTHEAVVRIMAGVAGDRWHSTGDFFAAASEAMRRILVDSARRRATLKRGAGRAERFELSSLGLAAPGDEQEILLVDDLLDALAADDAVAAEVVRLRYFGGLTVPEVADALGMNRRTVDRRWAYARAWFGRQERRSQRAEDARGTLPART